MTQQILNTGIVANDGRGDTLRVAASKINDNFTELYGQIGGDSSVVRLTHIGAEFEGYVTNDHQTTIIAIEPTTDNEIYLPDASGTIILDSDTQTLSNKTILVPTITTPKIQDANASHTYDITVGDIAANTNINIPTLSDSDTFVFENHTQTLRNKTIAYPILNNPILGGVADGSLLLDSSSNEYLKLTSTASAVNHAVIKNSATGNAVEIDVDGDDTDISLKIAAKGSGAIQIVNKLVLEKGTDVASTEAVDLDRPLVVFNSGSLISPTLPDGTVVGETKHFINVGAGQARLTTGSTTNIYGVADNGHVRFEEGDGCILVWNVSESKWFFLANNGTTIGT